MPLDADIRRYADNLFAQKKDSIDRESTKKIRTINQTHHSSGLTGALVKAMVEERTEHLQLLCDAKIEALFTAYKRAGILFDKAVYQEMMDEMSQFIAQTELVFANQIGKLASSNSQGSKPGGFEYAMVGEFAESANSVRKGIWRRLQLKLDEIVLDEKRGLKTYPAASGKKWDVFICHATEDKNDFVRPLAQALISSGLTVWFDELTLRVGDSLRRKIDEGLASSRFGVVVLSPNFFAKPWPQEELDGLYSREVGGVKVILPVWHNITADQVCRYSPLMASRLAATGEIEEVVAQLRSAMGL
jgi:hypothetical protein